MTDPSLAYLNQADLNGGGVIQQGELFQSASGGGVGGSAFNSVGESFATSGTGEGGLGFRGDANAIFNQVDMNNDNFIDRNEFAQFIGGGFNVGGGNIGGSSFNAGGGNIGGSSFNTDGSSFNAGGSGFNAGGSGFNAGGSGFNVGGGGSSSSGICIPPVYSTDANGYFRDSNPLVENRANTGPQPTYTQRIRVSFLQPPPLPPGPLNYIKEVRPPLPNPPPPVRRTERGREAPKPPTLYIRERPPQRPPVVPGTIETVLLPPFPQVPRSVITEVFPSPPPQPRDIILERWIPYGPQSSGRTIRIPAPCGPFPTPPRNRIIRYAPAQARVVREFQRLGVTQADPEAYLRRYGDSLLDTARFVQQARAVGIVEDISPPANNSALQSSTGNNLGIGSDLSGGGFGGAVSEGGFGGAALGGGFGGAALGGASGGVTSSGFSEVSSFESVSGDAGFGGNVDAVGNAFLNADTNRDGTLSAAEFGNLNQSGL